MGQCPIFFIRTIPNSGDGSKSIFKYFRGMESTRQLKISKLIQKELGEILRLNGSQYSTVAAMITPTRVTVTKDLSIAKVYISIFGNVDKQVAFKNLSKHNNTIRRILAEKVRFQLRVIPELIFVFDDSLDYIDRIDTLLNH